MSAQEQQHSLAGTWHSQDETLSDIQYTITFDQGTFAVSAIDAYDNEHGEVYDVKWDEQNRSLLFCCYWESTERFSKCKLHEISRGKAEFTYQYTDHEILIKKQS